MGTTKMEIGTKINRMTYLLPTQSKGPHRYGFFACDCGTVKEVRISHVRQGGTQSCGCVQQENRTKHGMWGTRVYSAWQDMKGRCSPTAANRAFYHDKGIRVCARWVDDFNAFYADMGDCPSGYELDREDNGKEYSPENCRWVTKSQNVRNRDRSRPRSQSPYRNVSPCGKRWKYRTTEDYKTLWSKQSWETPKEAAVAYNEYAARMGFPLIKDVLQ